MAKAMRHARGGRRRRVRPTVVVDLSSVREQRRRELAEVPQPEREGAAWEPAVESQIEQTLTAVATEQALDALAPDERRLIRLRYVHDLTQGQVAEVMGVPEGTVKVRLHRVRARLRVRAGELAA